MKKRIEFKAMLNNEFGVGITTRKAHVDPDPEDTFRNILKSMPKRLEKQWYQIWFDQGNTRFTIDKQALRESEFNFWATVETEEH